MRTIHKMYTDNICVTYYACGVIDNTPPKITSHDILMLGLEGEMEIKKVANPLTMDPNADIVVFIIFPAPFPRKLIHHNALELYILIALE